MSTLLLRIVAPLQSWGTQSHFTMRDSGLEPSKSGIIGLVCAAMGRPRCESLEDLTSLRMGVRVDRPGMLQRDFQVVQDVLLADAKKTKNLTTNRYYLAGAAFLVALEGETELLQNIWSALQKPVWPLYLGRKAYVPSQPVWMSDGLRLQQTLEQALADCGWLVDWSPHQEPEQVLCVIDDVNGGQMRNDVPLSFSDRTFGSRHVSTVFIKSPSVCREEVS